MWDTKHFHAYPVDKSREQIGRAETFVYCNLLARLVHVDAYSLFKGADDVVTRTLINQGSGFNGKGDFMSFLHDMRQPALQYQLPDPAVAIDPNSWFAGKLRILHDDIGAFFITTDGETST